MNARHNNTGRGAAGQVRPGTAMIEFVLILPLIGAIIAFSFFFGWAMMHKHQVVVADRYAAWKRVETGAWPADWQINQTCFADNADQVVLDHSGGTRTTAQDLVDVASQGGAYTELLAEELVLNRWPRGHTAEVTASFSHAMQVALRNTGSIVHRHSREGITWRREDVAPWAGLCEVFYSDLDDSLQQVQAPGDTMAQMIRHLYITSW